MANRADGVHTYRSPEAVDGTVTFAVSFDRGQLSDWDIEPLLSAVIGPEATATELARLQERCPAGRTSFAPTPIAD